MSCQKCKSERVAYIQAKHSDCFGIQLGNVDYDGYAPEIPNLCNGDYTRFNVCLDCGQLQGEFPIPQLDLEKETNENDVRIFYENYFRVGSSVKMIVQRNDRYRLLEWAEEQVSFKFRNWLKEFIKYTTICPSIDEFVEWFKNNKYSDEE